MRDVGLVFQRRQELQKGQQSRQMPRAGTSPVRGTNYYCQCGPTRPTPESRPGHHGRLTGWTWAPPPQSCSPPGGKDAWLQNSLQLLVAWCSCTTHHPKWVFKGLHYVLGFFLCNRQWSLSTFLSARLLQGQTKTHPF